MPNRTCPDCQTPKSQWKENKGQGCRVDNHVYCSQDCANTATKSVQSHGTINQEDGKERKHRMDAVASKLDAQTPPSTPARPNIP